ncbi:unnamed protein product [Brugia pahangi]|uniref:Ovule protein n=1 Tax=Brugia pahangi TaxID=6280 RepID=A0A0N4T440_BRUPA|nr:unnamed protein product [Brugia pahangi]
MAFQFALTTSQYDFVVIPLLFYPNRTPIFSSFFEKGYASQNCYHYISLLRQWTTRSTNAKFLIFNLF